MSSRNRGIKKPKLRDLSTKPLTREESAALLEAMFVTKPPVAAAILGAVLVEHQLDVLLRRRFTRNDDDTWAELTADNGPLSTFSAKITAAHAFGICDKTMRANLNIVRTIRNAFAHSKKLIDFNHELIEAELGRIKIPERKGSLRKEITKVKKHPKEASQFQYVDFCTVLGTELLSREVKALNAVNYRLKKRLQRTKQKIASSPYFNALTPYMQLPQANSKLNQQSFPQSQSGDPSREARIGLLSGLLDQYGHRPHKKGK